MNYEHAGAADQISKYYRCYTDRKELACCLTVPTFPPNYDKHEFEIRGEHHCGCNTLSINQSKAVSDSVPVSEAFTGAIHEMIGEEGLAVIQTSRQMIRTINRMRRNIMSSTPQLDILVTRD